MQMVYFNDEPSVDFVIYLVLRKCCLPKTANREENYYNLIIEHISTLISAANNIKEMLLMEIDSIKMQTNSAVKM